MHVLFVTAYYPSEALPVTGIFFHDQATALHQAGHQVGVITTPRLNITLELGKRHGWSKLGAVSRDSYFQEFPVYRMHWGWFPRPLPAAVMLLTVSAGLRAYEAYCKAHGRPDVIHAQNIFYAGTLVAEIKRKHGISAVLTEHSSSFLRGLVIFPGQPAIIQGTLRGMDVCLAVGKSLAAALHPYAPEVPIEIIGNIVDTDFFTMDAPPDPEPFKFASVGRIDKNKSLDLLLRAFQQAFEGQNVRLEIGGDGPARAALEQFVGQAGLEKQVKFLGWLAREQVREVMQRSHALTLTSQFETFGLVLAEAMACGKPVVSTRSGGPEDLVNEDNGLLVDGGDVHALAQVLIELRQNYSHYDPARIRATVVERYSREAYVARLEAIYRRASGT